MSGSSVKVCTGDFNNALALPAVQQLDVAGLLAKLFASFIFDIQEPS